jgi:hypothetical protein
VVKPSIPGDLPFFISFRAERVSWGVSSPLLNVDYKICSSSIAQRLKKVLHTIISETQVGFMKGRYIGECTRLVCDLIDRCEDEEIPGRNNSLSLGHR